MDVQEHIRIAPPEFDVVGKTRTKGAPTHEHPQPGVLLPTQKYPGQQPGL